MPLQQPYKIAIFCQNRSVGLTRGMKDVLVCGIAKLKIPDGGGVDSEPLAKPTG